VKNLSKPLKPFKGQFEMSIPYCREHKDEFRKKIIVLADKYGLDIQIDLDDLNGFCLSRGYNEQESWECSYIGCEKEVFEVMTVFSEKDLTPMIKEMEKFVRKEKVEFT
jgi:hypothetical protein